MHRDTVFFFCVQPMHRTHAKSKMHSCPLIAQFSEFRGIFHDVVSIIVLPFLPSSGG